MEYISNNLGVSFYYPSPQAAQTGQAIFIKEISNKIYLYGSNTNKPFTGTDDEFLKAGATTAIGFIDYKYVEVLNKNPRQSLVDAIKQQVFHENIPNQCYITTTTHYGDPREDESFERAVIWTYPSHRNLSLQEDRNYVLNCTSYAGDYIGVSYFMMDPKHPDRFLFVSLGQDNISSGINGYTWDSTIKVF